MEWGAAPELVGPRHYYRVGLMARVLAGWLPPAGAPRVLDAGAGRGTLAALLAARGYRVTALDASAGFTAYLAAAGRGPAADRVLPVQGDVTRLPFAGGAFAAVVCGEVLEHVADDAAAVAELARVLQSGGLLVATVPLGRARYTWLDRWAGHLRRYERDELVERLTAGGFAVLTVRQLGFPLGLLYERWVQRPVLGQAAQGADRATLAQRFGGAAVTRALGTALFRLDEPCSALPYGTGLLAVARR